MFVCVCPSRSLWLRWCALPLAMPPAMTDLLDIWAAHSPLAGHAPDQITVDFLLPTGIYIQMDVPREATIQHIKLVSDPRVEGRGGEGRGGAKNGISRQECTCFC